jgi:hypothetical protein
MTETNDGNEELGSSGTVPFPDRSALGKLRALIALPFFGAAAFLTPTIFSQGENPAVYGGRESDTC